MRKEKTMRLVGMLALVLALSCGGEEENLLYQCQSTVACADGTSATIVNMPHCYESATCAAAGFNAVCVDAAISRSTCGTSTPTSCGECTCEQAGECAAQESLACPSGS